MTDDWKRRLDRLRTELVNRDDPAELVAEADAMDASYRYPHVAVRGPVFGIAVQDPAAGSDWRLLKPVTDGMPQQARDGLNSLLWFRARDDTDDPRVRRELLAAVAVLEREPVNDLEVLGVRYRVVRGDEFARTGEDGLEAPRPTDREPVGRSWDVQGARGESMSPDVGFVLNPYLDVTSPMAGALKLGLRDFSYAGGRYPADVCDDSERAVATHPDVVLLPVGFGVAERREKGWRPRGSLMPTPHEARRMLYTGMTVTWPVLFRFDDRQRAVFAAAAEEFRAAGHANEVRVDDRLFRICRIERLVRVGPAGPETPRPSDLDDHGPTKMHPPMEEDGTIHHAD